MKLTRSNIAYDLELSPHRAEMPYCGNQHLTFIFSSELYKNKFLEKRKDNRDYIEQSLKKRFGFTINAEILSDIRLYTTIEKRGFLIVKEGEKIKCLNNLILDGVKVTIKS